MRQESLGRIIRFGLQNYVRNGWISVAVTFVLAVTLFIISVFVLQVYVIKSATKSIADKLDMAIYINDTPTEDDVLTFISEIRAMPQVKEVVYLNKSQVIDEWNRLHVNEKIKSQVNADNNPLPRTIKVKTTNPSDLDIVAQKINASSFAPNIRNVSYRDNRPIIKQLVDQSRKITRNGIIVSIIFTALSIMFVYNTLRIVIRFRQEETAVMKLVGATDSFIRGPFLIEGTLYGLVAGLLTTIALYFYLQNGLSDSTPLLASSNNLLADQLFGLYRSHLVEITALLAGSGALVAVLCSIVSVHHDLRR